MMTKRNWMLLTAVSLAVSLTAHAFMLSEWFHGRYLLGSNDGLSQMVPFKHFLYEALKEGNYFYSERFGFGGGIFSQLGYYFSTSAVFLLTAAVTALLDWSGAISPSLEYWADVTVFVSVIRLTIIQLLAVRFFRLTGLRSQYAYAGAVLYSVSILYFRHVTYWEFFADAMLFLPLLLIGAERIIRFAKPGVFITAVALSMADNFYFAYVNFLLAFIYILFRWFVPLARQEAGRLRQVRQFVTAGLLGALLSAPFFVPAVYGFLNNLRPPFEEEIPLFKFHENVLTNSRIVSLPAFTIIGLLLFPLYKKRLFRLFAAMTAFLAVLHMSPAAGSLFNGLSAPQYRWEHMLMLAAGGMAACTLQYWEQLRVRQVMGAAAGTAILYMVFALFVPGGSKSEYSVGLIVMALILCTVSLFAAVRKPRQGDAVLYAAVIGASLITVNLFQETKLTHENPDVGQSAGKGVPRSFLSDDAYDAAAPRELIRRLTETEPDPLARIDWMIGTRNNTPIVQEFLGMSLYSSLLNKQLLQFYWNDLSIDMGRESVSRYAGLGGRANLYSLLNGVYAVRGETGNPVPYDFRQAGEQDGYRAYESVHRLPFVRTAGKVFTEPALEDAPAIAREHAMLSGVILSSEDRSEPAPAAENLAGQAAVAPVHAVYEGETLTVTDAMGGLDIRMTDPAQLKQDTYIAFHLTRATADRGFELTVNDYRTTRKRTDSIYRTRVDDMTIRIPSPTDGVIRIRLPKGTYTFRDLALYAEDYGTLARAEQRSGAAPAPKVKWKGGRASIRLENPGGDPYAVMPIPYEKGWRAYVNGERTGILKANYAFTGLPIQPGTNTIELVYSPPYIGIALLLALSAAAILSFACLRHHWNRPSPR